MKAATLLNILSHLPAEAEVVLGEAESAILAEFRKILPAHWLEKVLDTGHADGYMREPIPKHEPVADKVVPPAPPAAPVPPAE